METLRSFTVGRWHTATDGFVPLYNPSTEEQIAQVSSVGLDFGEAVTFARDRGGEALRSMTFAERGAMIGAVAKALHSHREELLELSMLDSGVTRKDAKFDVDGATGTLSYFGYLGKDLGDRKILFDGEGEALGRSARFWGRHALVPRQGVAVHINAFNFPAWGFAEKAAQAWLAGMPVITKPATSTAWVTARCVEIIAESGLLPEGVLSIICGSTGDLLKRLGSQDVLAFTGSAQTGHHLRSIPELLERNVPVNIEADSLNATVLAPGVREGSETWGLFLRDVSREITQKAGQKCTAVRRIFVPRDQLNDVRDALAESLASAVVGNPLDSTVTVGALATSSQLADAVEGCAALESVAKRVFGTGERIDGVGSPVGKGWFFGPTLFEADDFRNAPPIHELEVFAPVSSILPYDGSPSEAMEGVALGGGSLVTALYGDDPDWFQSTLEAGGCWSGRFYLGSEKMAEQALGSGLALPQSLHGGPGRAGGGAELGGWRGIGFYQQRIALQGYRKVVDELC